MTYKQEVPGNVLATAALVQREMLKFANALMIMDGQIQEGTFSEHRVVSLRLALPSDKRPDVLAVLTIETAEGRMVAFHSDSGLVSALKGLAHKYSNQTLKFRKDKWQND